MNTVEPIRSKEKIEEIHKYLSEKNERDALLFSLGIYTGLRISDILKLKVKDCWQNYYNIRELKTGKQKVLDWNPYLNRELKKFIENRRSEEYVFKSREGGAITRQRAYQIIRKACNDCKIYNVGTHTLRKTFGYHTYNKTKNVAMLMDIFNHSSPDITLRYIGISQESNNKVIKNLKFF